MNKLRWIANTYDPELPKTKPQPWLEGKIIGEPQPTPGSDLTTEQLKAMGLVGVYVAEQAHGDTPPAENAQ